MIKKHSSGTFLFLFLASAAVLTAQFTPEEIARRPEIEVLLKTADVYKAEDIGEGVTRPCRLYMQSEDEEISGCWKNPKGKQHGYLEGWQYEIAAYEMDKLLDLHMVPPTVERSHEGKPGSLQFWVTSEMSDLDRMEKGINIPNEAVYSWENSKYLARAFDCLIGNDDRTQQNVRYTKDWRTILIDHSRSFRSTRDFKRGIPYGKNGFKSVQLFRRLPRTFVEKVKSLSFDGIKAAVGSYLTDEEIEAVLLRREILLKEIEEWIREKGEENYLY